MLSAQLITAPTGKASEILNLAPAEPPRPKIKQNIEPSHNLNYVIENITFVNKTCQRLSLVEFKVNSYQIKIVFLYGLLKIQRIIKEIIFYTPLLDILDL